MRAALGLLSSVALAFAVSGCGSDGGDGASPSGDEGRPGATQRLTPAQYAALEDVYEAALPLDELRQTEQPASRSKLSSMAEPIVVACERLDGDEQPLRELRESCLASIRLLLAQPAAGECGTAESCQAAIEETRAAIRAMVNASRAADRAVDATANSPACKRALRTPQVAYAYYRRLDARLRAVGEALRSGSAAEVRAAAAALAHVDGDEVPSARQSLNRFRAGCR